MQSSEVCDEQQLADAGPPEGESRFAWFVSVQSQAEAPNQKITQQQQSH